MERNVELNVLLLVGKDAITIPALAVVGAASIMGAIGYGAYKLGQNLAEKVFEKKRVKNETES